MTRGPSLHTEPLLHPSPEPFHGESDIVERLRSTAQLPVCPYDRRSPDYWTTPDDQPCVICGTLNEVNAPNLCKGADTRIMEQAAAEIERLRREAECHRHMADNNYANWSAATDERDVALELLSRVHQLGQTGGWRRMPGGLPFSATELATDVAAALRAAGKERE